MKKTVCLILALLTLFSLTACGDSAPADGINDGQQAPEDAASVQEEPAAEQPEPMGEPVTLVMACGFGTNDLESVALNYLCDYVEEHTGGTVTFERYLGGTLCILPEEFSMMTSGAIDIIALLPDMAINSFPYINFPQMAEGSQEAAIDLFNYLVFENEETSALIQEQAEANNVKILGTSPAGLFAFASTKPAESLSDLAGLKMGCTGTQEKYNRIGLTTVSTNSSDIYDCLSRGVYDCTAMGVSTVVSNKWYEVAPYCGLMEGYQAAPHYVMNLDSWNKLSAEQQAVFMEAAEKACEYACELSAQSIASSTDVIEEAGGTVNYFSQEDTTAFVKSFTTDYIAAARTAAENLGCQEGMETILAAACERLGMDLSEFSE